MGGGSLYWRICGMYVCMYIDIYIWLWGWEGVSI